MLINYSVLDFFYLLLTDSFEIFSYSAILILTNCIEYRVIILLEKYRNILLVLNCVIS